MDNHKEEYWENFFEEKNQYVDYNYLNQYIMINFDKNSFDSSLRENLNNCIH